MTDIERRFNSRMVEIYQLAKKLCNYNATRFMEMISRPEGAVSAAKQLLRGDQVQYGLMELYHCGHLEISVEAAVVSDEFRELFTEEDIAVAQKRLKDLRYDQAT